MAKRRAAGQITKDIVPGNDSSSDEEEVDQGQAAPDVLARRKIAVPRTRLNKPSGESASSGASNPFGSLGQPSAAAAAPANPFGFLGKPSQAPTETAKPALGAFGMGASTNATTSSSDSIHSSKELRMRGLNTNFASQISKANSQSPFEDWTTMCEKYISYAKQISGETSEKPAAFSLSQKAPAANEPSTSKDDKSTKSEITATGFKFGDANAATASTFTFGDKNVDMSKSHTSKPSGGFVFNPNGPGEIKPAPSGDVSLMQDEGSDDNEANAEQAKKSDKGESKPVFSFGSSANTSSGNSEKPAFSFGSVGNSKENNGNPAFSFGSAGESKDKPQPAFSFGSSASQQTPKSNGEESKPAFSFGSLKKDNDSSSKPSTPFSFAKPSAAADSKTESTSPQPFSFGASNSQSNEPKPAFTLGAASSTNETNASKPTFSFGGASTSVSDDASKDQKSEEPKPFAFGNPASKFSFTFGSSSSTNTSAEKPKFSFGAQQPNNLGFSFGTGVNPFGKSPDTKTTEGGRVDATWNPANPIKIAAAEGDKKPSESNEGEPSEEQNDPQADLGGPGPGEEDEENVYEKKSKIFELADGQYKPLGLGMLRILVHKETHKARALVRAEGSGRVLLNVTIRKEFNYTAIGKGQVKVLDVKPGNDSPTVYVLRVKTEEDGNELKDKLEQVKN